MIKDNSKRAYRLIIVFSIIIVVSLISIISDYLQLSLLEKITNESFVSEEEIEYNDTRETVIGILQTLTYLISVFFFLFWFRRAYANLERADIKIKHDNSWAVWSFIVPIISLFRPLQIMKEIWIKTQKKVKQLDPTYITNYNTTPIILWWVLFIASNVVGRYILRNSFKEDTLDSLIQLTEAYLISDSIQIIEALLILFIVSKISKMETSLINLHKHKTLNDTSN